MRECGVRERRWVVWVERRVRGRRGESDACVVEGDHGYSEDTEMEKTGE